MWPETIASNIASERVAREHAPAGTTTFDALHASDYLAYAWLQLGEYDKVRALVDTLAKVTAIDTETFAADYALAAVPARYALERHKWSEAAALAVRPTKFGYAEALTHFARAMGFARSGDVAHAHGEVERLNAIKTTLNPYWAEQVEIQRRAADAWIARADGRNDEAVTLMQSAADLEDATEKSPVTPGALDARKRNVRRPAARAEPARESAGGLRALAEGFAEPAERAGGGGAGGRREVS